MNPLPKLTQLPRTCTRSFQTPAQACDHAVSLDVCDLLCLVGLSFPVCNLRRCRVPAAGDEGAGGGGPWRRETWHVLPSVAVASEAEHRLFERLFEDYNEIIRPVANVSDPVIIQFEVSMSQLVKVVSAGAATGAWGAGLGRASPRTSPVSVFRRPLGLSF